MGSRVLFAITEDQADYLHQVALERVRAGGSLKVEPEIRTRRALERRGLVEVREGFVVLTDLGTAAQALCARLAGAAGKSGNRGEGDSPHRAASDAGMVD